MVVLEITKISWESELEGNMRRQSQFQSGKFTLKTSRDKNTSQRRRPVLETR